MADGTIKILTELVTDGLKKGLGLTTKLIAGAASSLAGLGTAAIKVGSSFEAGMSEVAAISGTTGKDLESLTAKAKEMGAATKFSASESADAMKYMAMAGWKTKDMLGGIEGIMNLAAASGEDLALTSDIVTDALTAFGMQAKESGHFADVLAAASSNANTNVALMGETFKYVAPVAGSLGYSVEDMSVAIGLMANSGIKGSQAGTALRSTLTRLAKPTKESGTAMDKLGITLTDGSGKMKSFAEIMGDMRKGFAGLTEDEKACYAAMLGGQEAMSGLLAIVNSSDEDFDKLTKAINGADGAAKDMAETMQDNLNGQVTILKSSLEGLGIEVYESVQTPLKELAKQGIKYVNQLTEAFQKGGFAGLAQELGSVLASIVSQIVEAAPKLAEAAVQMVYGLLSGIQSNLPVIAEGAAELAAELVKGLMTIIPQLLLTGVKLVAELARGIAKQIPSLMSEWVKQISSFWLELGNMIPEVIKAGIALIQGLIKGLKGALPQLIAVLPSIINAVLDGLMEAIPLLLDAAVEFFMAIVDAIPIIVTLLGEALPTIIDNITSFIVASLPQIINAAIQMLNGLVQAIPVIIDALVTALPSIIDSIVDCLLSSIPVIIQAGIDLLTALVGALPEIIAAIVQAIPLIIDGIITAIINAIPLLIQAGIDLLIALIGALPEIITTIVKAIPQIIDGIVSGLIGNIDKIIMAGVQLFVALIENLPAIIIEIVKAVPQIITGIAEAFGSLTYKIIEIGGDLLKGIWEGIKNAASWLWDKITGFFSGIVDGIKDFLGIHSPSKVFAGIGGNMASGIGEGFSDTMDDVSSDMLGAMGSVGTQMCEGLKSGMNSQVSSLTKAAKGVADKVTNAFRAKLEIHSPSRLMARRIGKPTAQGIGVGFTNAMKGVVRDMENSVELELARLPAGAMKMQRELVYNTKEAQGGNTYSITNNIESPEPITAAQAVKEANQATEDTLFRLGVYGAT